jgi:hypothetical protein
MLRYLLLLGRRLIRFAASTVDKASRCIEVVYKSYRRAQSTSEIELAALCLLQVLRLVDLAAGPGIRVGKTYSKKAQEASTKSRVLTAEGRTRAPISGR